MSRAPFSPDELLALFERRGIAHRTVPHEAVFTVAQSQALERDLPGGHVKNLFLKDKKGALFLVTAHAHAAIDLKRLHLVLGGSGRLSFGSAERLRAALGVEPGSVTPFAVVNDPQGLVRSFIDRRLLAFETINAHPLVNTMTTALARDDLLRFLAEIGRPPVVVDLPAPADLGGEAGAEAAATPS